MSRHKNLKHIIDDGMQGYDDYYDDYYDQPDDNVREYGYTVDEYDAVAPKTSTTKTNPKRNEPFWFSKKKLFRFLTICFAIDVYLNDRRVSN